MAIGDSILEPPEFTDDELRDALKRVGENARRRAFAAGLPITVLEGSQLVLKWADGRREVIERSERLEESL